MVLLALLNHLISFQGCGEPTVSGCGELLTELLKRYGSADQETLGGQGAKEGGHGYIHTEWMVDSAATMVI